MIEIHLDEGFKRSYKKIIRNNDDLKIKFFAKLKLLGEDPFHPLLKTHKLSGILKEYYAFSLDFKIRIVFKIMDSQNIVLISIGSHDSVY